MTPAGAAAAPRAEGGGERDRERRWSTRLTNAMVEGQPGLAVPLLVGVGLLIAWWGWKEGAYFDEVFYPGEIAVAALLALYLWLVPYRGRIAGPIRLTLVGLVGLAAWTLLSILWTPARHVAVFDASRAILYAAIVLLGVWACILLGRRMTLALAPVGIAGAVVGVATTISIATSTDPAALLHDDATLFYPIGYRNAAGCFFLLCVWPLLAIACESRYRWWPRALAVGSATLLIDLAVLAQSRGSLPAAFAALLVFVLASPRPAHAVAFIGLASLPVLPVLPDLLEVFQHGGLDPEIVPILHSAARGVLISSVASALIAAIAIRKVEPRVREDLPIGHGLHRRWRIAAIVALLAPLLALVAAKGGPIEFLDQRAAEFGQGGNPDLLEQGARFGTNAGSNRNDMWRVSLEQAGDHPVLGGGAGSFEVSYLAERDTEETPKDPHSVEMLMVGELGLPGLALFGCFAVAASVGLRRVRSLGPGAAFLAAAAGASAVGWLIQASYDWFWHYPGVTIPPLFLVGAAIAPLALDPLARPGKRARAVGIGACGLAAVVALSLFLSDRYVDRADRTAARSLAGAYVDLDRAADLDPFSPGPLLAESSLAISVNDLDRAREALEAAIDRMPDNFSAHMALAELLFRSDRERAAEELVIAKQLNPNSERVRVLERALRS